MTRTNCTVGNRLAEILRRGRAECAREHRRRAGGCAVIPRDQRIVDKLQVIVPTLQRTRVTLKQQLTDVDAALAAAEAIVAIVRPAAPVRRGERSASLELAAIRSGHTLAGVARLSGMAPSRIAEIIAGAGPTVDERAALTRVLPDWRAGQD